MDKSDIIRHIQSSGYRLTPQRLLVIDTLYEHQERLLSADQLLNACKIKDKKINTTTIYRNLDALAALELLFINQLDRTTTGYKLICNHSHHHHMVCVQCGAITPIDYCPMGDGLIALAQTHNFKITDHHMELRGYCSQCQSPRLS